MKEKLNQWMYYAIIFVVSFIALVFLPMFGSPIGLGWAIPTTIVGWVVWIASKAIIATLNVLIFHCFMLQAKVNVAANEKYKEANEILMGLKQKDYIPRSPHKWNKQQYSKKGIMIFATTALSTVALTQAILTFDWISMLTYLFTIIMGLIFGILQMKAAEYYWTAEYWEYAQMKKKEQEQEQEINEINSEENVNDNLQQQGISELGGTSPQEQAGYSVSL